MIMD
jgi:hypothetical protein